MKLTTVLLLLTFLHVSATGISQKVSFDFTDAKIETVLNSIKAQTGYSFFYNADVLRDANTVSVVCKKSPLADALEKVFKDQPLEYNIIDKTIVIRKKAMPVNTVNVVEEEVLPPPPIVITGKVTDENGAPLANASVQVIGSKIGTTTIGTTTNTDGEFSLTVDDKATHLVISYVNRESVTVNIKGKTKINVVLKPVVSVGENLVVVGYGTQSKAKVTGAISKLDLDNIQDYSVTNLDQALAGKLPGVQVIQSTGRPGGELDFRIRGTNSITAGVSPLFVLDGVPLDGSGKLTEYVNIEDIKSFEVLKDASAAAIYGSRASNGVVLITTKLGSVGKLKVDVKYTYGIQSLSKKIDMMDAYEYAALSRDAHNNAYLDEVPTGDASDPNSVRTVGYYKIPEELFPYLNGETGLTNTDWQDEIYRNAQFNKAYVSLSGGTPNLRYRVSGNYTKQQGIIINSDYTKYNLLANLEYKKNKFGFEVYVAPSYTTENRVSADNAFFDDGIVQSALEYSPTWPVYNSDGSFNYDGNGYWRIGTDYQHNEILNPVALATLISNDIDHYNLYSRVSANYEFIKGLVFKSSFAYTFNAYQQVYYRPSELPTRGAAYYTDPSNPSAQLSNTNITNWLLENTLTYNKKFGDHSLNLLGGISQQKNTSKLNRTTSSVTSETTVRNAIQVVNADQEVDSDGSISQWGLYSVFARAQYDYKAKYLLAASIRADASSRFGENNKWGYFPSVSLGWRMSKEDFMKDINWINELKLRASYGLTGNFQIGNYEHIATVRQDNYVLGDPEQVYTALSPSQISNADLSWEKTAMFNVGLDATVLQRQLSFSIEYYNSKTKDLLLDVPVPQATGFGTALQNIGKVRNSGVEFSASIAPKLNQFTWVTNLNISYNKNKVLALGPENADIISQGPSSSYWITKVGGQIGSYYLMVIDGIFANDDELTRYPHFSNTHAGDFRFVDIDGDGFIDVSADRDIVGNYAPDYIYGASTMFAYKGFDLNVAINGVYGNEILNLNRRYIANSEGNFNNTREMLDRWKSASDPGNLKVNRANRKAKGNNGRISTWHLESGSYVRLQNVSLGYSFPQETLKKLKLSQLRIYVSGNNIYTWTNYTGYNPEVNLDGGSDQLTPGLDYGVYPLARSFSVGVNLSF